jgi:hypothetical protein
VSVFVACVPTREESGARFFHDESPAISGECYRLPGRLVGEDAGKCICLAQVSVIFRSGRLVGEDANMVKNLISYIAVTKSPLWKQRTKRLLAI